MHAAGLEAGSGRPGGRAAARSKRRVGGVLCSRGLRPHPQPPLRREGAFDTSGRGGEGVEKLRRRGPQAPASFKPHPGCRLTPSWGGTHGPGGPLGGAPRRRWDSVREGKGWGWRTTAPAWQETDARVVARRLVDIGEGEAFSVREAFGLTPSPLSAAKVPSTQPSVAERGWENEGGGAQGPASFKPHPGCGLTPSWGGTHGPGEPLGGAPRRALGQCPRGQGVAVQDHRSRLAGNGRPGGRALARSKRRVGGVLCSRGFRPHPRAPLRRGGAFDTAIRGGEGVGKRRRRGPKPPPPLAPTPPSAGSRSQGVHGPPFWVFVGQGYTHRGDGGLGKTIKQP